MNTAHTLQKLSKLGKILSKIAFVFAVIGFVGCIVGIASAQFGSGPILKLGGVTLYGLIPGSLSGNIKGAAPRFPAGSSSARARLFLPNLRKFTFPMF